MVITIRAMDLKNDIAEMVELTTQLGYPTSKESFLLRMNTILQHPDYTTFVAVLDQKVVGYLGLVKQYAWEMDHPFYKIQALVVNQSIRKKGIGKALLAHVEMLAKENNISLILLNSGNRPERADAHKFYLHMGFEAKSTGFRKNLK